MADILSRERVRREEKKIAWGVRDLPMPAGGCHVIACAREGMAVCSDYGLRIKWSSQIWVRFSDPLASSVFSALRSWVRSAPSEAVPSSLSWVRLSYPRC